MSSRGEFRRRSLWIGLMLLVLVGSSEVVLSFAPPGHEKSTIEGTVLCVDAEGSPEKCGADPQRFALRSDGGDLYLFSPHDPLVNLFKDERVRRRRFQIKVWTRDDRYVDIVKIHSIKDGKLYDIYFYCSTCNIKSYEAGDCWCCHQPYELKEVPVDD